MFFKLLCVVYEFCRHLCTYTRCVPCKRKVIASVGTGDKDGCELRNELVRAMCALNRRVPYRILKTKKKGIVMS